MNKFRRNDDSRDDGPIANNRISAHELRVMDQDGEQIGIMSKHDALNLAHDQQLDLVLIVPKAEPPVAKIISLNKYNYELKKREKLQAKNARANAIEIKEVKFRPGIGDHDLQIKMSQAQKFIDKGAKVKITIQMRGRENSKAGDVLGYFTVKLDEHLENYKFESPLKMAGNRILGVITKNE